MAQLYEVTVSNINYHINKIFKDSELQKNSVIKKFLITADDGTAATSAKKPAAAKKPASGTAKKTTGTSVKVTATEKKLLELYRAADSATKKEAMAG